MNKITFVAFVALTTLSAPMAPAAADLATLGASSFSLDDDFTYAGASQTSTTLVFGVPFSGGANVYGTFSSLQNWSTAPQLALSLSSTVAPSVTLFMDALDSDFVTLASFSLSLTPVNSIQSSYTLNLESGSIANLTVVDSLFFTLGGPSISGDTAVTVHAVQAVPEPSTYALLVLGGVAVGGYVLRRRQRA